MLGMGIVGTIIVILVIVWLVRRVWSEFLRWHLRYDSSQIGGKWNGYSTMPEMQTSPSRSHLRLRRTRWVRRDDWQQWGCSTLRRTIMRSTVKRRSRRTFQSTIWLNWRVRRACHTKR